MNIFLFVVAVIAPYCMFYNKILIICVFIRSADSVFIILNIWKEIIIIILCMFVDSGTEFGLRGSQGRHYEFRMHGR